MKCIARLILGFFYFASTSAIFLDALMPQTKPDTDSNNFMGINIKPALKPTKASTMPSTTESPEARELREEMDTIKIWTAQLAAPAVILNSKAAAGAAAIPPLMAAGGALMGAVIAKPLVATSVAASGATAGLTGFSVALPYAAKRSMRRMMVNTKDKFVMVGHKLHDMKEGLKSKLSGWKGKLVDTQPVVMTPVVVPNDVQYVQLREQKPICNQEPEQLCFTTTYNGNAMTDNHYSYHVGTKTNDDVVKYYTAETTVNGRTSENNSNETMITILDINPNSTTTSVSNRIKRDAGLSSAEVKELFELIDALGVEDCVKRIICELNCDPNGHGEQGKKLLNSLMKLQLSMKGELRNVASYMKAALEGRKVRLLHGCKACSSTYPNCAAKSSALITVGSRIQIH